jgi:hypothetical protein
MKDMQAHLEKLRSDAAECALISNLATNQEKRELFASFVFKHHRNVACGHFFGRGPMSDLSP